MSEKSTTRTLAIGAMLTAVVIVLQLVASTIKFGPFSITLVLAPIVIGAALCGPWIGAWLGFVFGGIVLLSGDAALFLAASIPGTILTVLLKGTLCGLCAGFVYRWLSKKNTFVGTLVSAIVCPIVNTGVFLLGCVVFFVPTLTEWAGGEPVWRYMLFGLVGGNFLVELAINVVLSSVIVTVIKTVTKRHFS